MSLDRIIKIDITSDGVAIAQAGFGVPLILGKHDAQKPRVETYGSYHEVDSTGEAKGPVFEAAKLLFSQQPNVPKLKIAKRSSRKVTEDLSALWEEDNGFYGLLIDSTDTKDIQATAERIGSKRILFGADIRDAASPLPALFHKKNLKRTFCAFHESDPLAAAMMGKVLPSAPGSSSWAYQQLTGTLPSEVSTSSATALDSNNVNRYASFKGIGVTLNGKTASGEYIDVVRGIDWLHARMQERLFVLLVKNKKLPFTEKGVDLVRSEIMAQLKEAIFAGVLAADPEPIVTAPKIADIDTQDKMNRKLPKVRFSGRLAGAIHAIEIQGAVSP